MSVSRIFLPAIQAPIQYPPACLNQVAKVTTIQFPSFTGLQCNMMPFVMGKIHTLPKQYQSYWPLIEACKIPEVEHGKVGYLTISESFVKENATQRRPGIHVEKHSCESWGGGGWGGGSSQVPLKTPRNPQLPSDIPRGIPTDPPSGSWGGGVAWGGGTDQGSGLYQASNLDKTCRVWNCYVAKPGHMGDCEHLKDQLKDPIELEANQLVWMTDSCPHEAIPQRESGERQYFRLVTSHVGLWYKMHSTHNPLVALPKHVRIIEGNKFAPSSREKLIP